MKFQKGIAVIPLVLIILVILVVGGGAYYFGKTSAPVPLSPKPSPTPSPTATATPTTTPTQALTPTSTPTPNANLFNSPNLGISFYYTKKSTGINDSTIAVKQIGNKVYVYSTSGKPESGQWVEVFSKNSNQSLEDAIKEKILTGYSLTDCLVKATVNPISGQVLPASFVIAQINVPTGPNDDLGTITQKAEKCPVNYVATNGAAYFLMDKDHPDKFVFFSIGQYGIDSGITDKLWQNTITFLP